MSRSPAAGRGTAALPRIGEPVAAVPEQTLDALLGSLHEELASLQAQHDALAAMTGGGEGEGEGGSDGASGAEDRAVAAAGAANLLVAMENKRAQIRLLSSSSQLVGTLSKVVRSPVHDVAAAAKKADTLRTMAHLKGLAAAEQ